MPTPSRRPARAAALLCLLAAARAAAPSGLPQGLLLDGAVSGPACIVVGERGTIWVSPAPDAPWRRAASPARTTLTGVSFPPAPAGQAARAGWAVGHEAVILATTDGGTTWTRQDGQGEPQDSYLDVLALDERRAIAVGAYGLYAATADGGATWERRRIRDGDAHFNRLSRGPTGTLFLAGEAGTLLRSRDAGATWTPLMAPYAGSFYGVLPLDRRTILAHGLRGRVYRSDDEGTTWQEIPPPATALLATAVRLRGNLILLAGSARGVALSRDYGRSFALLPGSPATAIAELLELADGRVLALGEAGATPVILP